MGATAGHMLHPYENLDLTFDQMKNLFQVASQGFPKLKVTEKTDGQNIAIGYDPESGQTLAIRNKSHAMAGGLDKESLKNYFTVDRIAANKNPTPMNVVESFYDAMINFEKIATTLPPEFFITPEGERIFYNAEVMDPRSANVVDYDTQVLLIHRVGHKKLSNGNLRSFDAPEAERYSTDLEAKLYELQETAPELSTVKVNAIIDFTNFIEKKDAHRDAINELRAIQGSSKTVGEFLERRIETLLREKLGASYSESTYAELIKALLHFATKSMPRKTVEIASVLATLDEAEDPAFLNEFLRTRSAMKDIVDRSMKPLVMVVHRFGVKVLEGFIGGYALQSDVSLEKLRRKIGSKSRELSDPADLKILRTSIEKIHGGEDVGDVLSDASLESALQKITTSVEGLVFDYDGMTYKFTGQFAPVNQMMGLGKYDRGPKKEEAPGNRDEELTEAEPEFDRRKLIALVPGAFKPPHAGHFEMVRHYSEMVGPDGQVYILISPLTRGGGSDLEANVGFEESRRIWEIYVSQAALHNVVIYDKPSQSNSPVRQATEFIENEDDNIDFAQPGDEIILGCSDKPDDKGSPDYVRFGEPGQFQKYAREGASISDHVGPCFKTGPDAISATDFRKALQTGDDISQFIPPGVDQESIRNIFNTAPVQEQKKTFTLLYSLVEEALNEVACKSGKKWTVCDHNTDRVIPTAGKYDSKAAAEERASQMRRAKHAKLEEDDLEEISTTSAGSGGPGIEGGSGKKDDEEEALIREDDMIEQIMNYLVKSGIMEKQ